MSEAQIRYLKSLTGQLARESGWYGPARIGDPTFLPEGLRLAELQDELPDGGTATALLLRYDSGSGDWVPNGSDTIPVVSFAGGTFDAGTKVLCKFERKVWAALAAHEGAGGQDRAFVRFVTTEDFGATTAHQVAAVVSEAVGTDAPAPSTAITVHAYSSDGSFDDVPANAGGYAINLGTPSEPDYLILWAERVVRFVRAKASASICPDDVDVNGKIEDQAVVPFGDYVIRPGNPVNWSAFDFRNRYKHAAFFGSSQDQDELLFERRQNAKAEGKWVFELADVEKHEATIDQEWQLFDDDSTIKLQARGMKVAVEACDTLTDWEDRLEPWVVYRGVTDAAINKGASGTVSRYEPGTTTDSEINDTVHNDFANVASGKKVAYVKSGANFYAIAAEC
jgi:hypothetical protein